MRLTINQGTHEQADYESRHEGDDVRVANLIRRQPEVDLDGLWDQRRKGEPRQKSNEESNCCVLPWISDAEEGAEKGTYARRDGSCERPRRRG